MKKNIFMKRRFYLLALLLVLASAAALADAYDQPILFRGIPWGASYAELKEPMNLEDLESGINAAARFSYTTDAIIKTASSKTYENKKYSAVVGVSKDGIDAIGDVAGYELYKIFLYFAFVPDEDGSIVRDEEHTALYGAVYCTLGPIGVQKTQEQSFEDVKAKLSSLYGEPEMENTRPIWRGADGTMASLNKGARKSGVDIRYATEAGDAMLEACLNAEIAAKEAAKAAKEAEFSAKTNGL